MTATARVESDPVATAYVSPRYEGLKWAALGTSVTAYGLFTPALEAMLGVTCTNLGVGGATLSTQGGGTHNGAIYAALASIPADADLITLEPVNDFRLDVTLGTIADTSRATSFYGALYETCVWFRANRPNAMVFFLTPHGGTSADATTGKWNVNNANGNSLAQFRQAVRDVANLHGYPVLNVGEEANVGGPNTLSLSDAIHPSPTGGYRYAEYIRSKISGAPFLVDPIGKYTDLSLFIDSTKCEAGRLAVDQFGTLLAGMGRGAVKGYAGAIFKSAVRRVEYTAAMRTGGGSNWAIAAANATYAVGVGEDGLNSAYRFTTGTTSFDSGTALAWTGAAPAPRRVRLDIVAGKFRYQTATAKGGTFSQNYADIPNATTDATANIKAITDAGVQLGVIPGYSNSSPYPLGYDVYINDSPITTILKNGVLPA